jgi:hypothetical protein
MALKVYTEGVDLKAFEVERMLETADLQTIFNRLRCPYSERVKLHV